MILVSFKAHQWYFPTDFYNNFIIKEEIIKVFLSKISWKDIIFKNKGDVHNM